MNTPAKLAVIQACLLLFAHSFAQTATTARITGTVRDTTGAVIVKAEVAAQSSATGEKQTAFTDESGDFVLASVSPGSYRITISAPRFSSALYPNVQASIGGTLTINGTLRIANTTSEVTVSDLPPLVRSDSAELATILEPERLTTLPLPTRNFLQLLTVAPGVAAPLTNNNAIGRNSPTVSVNGQRVTQNTYEINGVNVNDCTLHTLDDVAVPAPEIIEEARVQTSLYDAAVAGGGGNLQVVTRSGSNALHGGIYEYFRNEAFNGNDANLNAVGEARPVMRRNVYGAALGGPLRRNKAFYFLSYQGSREANGATDQSLYRSVLIAPGLTDDRSEAGLLASFASILPAGTTTLDATAVKLLNAKLPSGKFLIPTPQTAEGLVTGTALSTYHEEQFNANLDYRPSTKDSVTAKWFFADAPLFSALWGSNFGTSASLPGFGTNVHVQNRVLAVREIHIFNPSSVNEARFGYSLTRHAEVPQESLFDSDLGMARGTASEYPGLPLILLAREQGGAQIGTPDITYRGTAPAWSLADVLSLQRGRHSLRAGGEMRDSQWRVQARIWSYGEIDFPTFADFLLGNSDFSHLATGLTRRDFRGHGYHFFVQDDWRLSPKLTLNLGLRYELDSPPSDTQGRIGGFDPALYRPRMEVDANGFPVGPPVSGIVEAGNAPPQYSLPGVTRVGKSLAKSVDPNNFGPRIGVAWSPLKSGGLVVRGGYGIFYSPQSFFYLALEFFAPPFFLDNVSSGRPFTDPFGAVPPESSYPLIQPGAWLGGWYVDRNMRTPYVQQFNGSIQYQPARETVAQIAYVGSSGVKLLRSVSINQARIASTARPLVNTVTGELFTDNAPDNAALRAPMQGVDPAFFMQNQSSAHSSYHSLQATLDHRAGHGLRFSAAYTFSRSIDNGSNPGGGAGTDGSVDMSGGLDTAFVVGNQLSPRANRGLSDYDRTHRLVLNYIWDIPQPALAKNYPAARLALTHWHIAGIATIMSGLPVDIFDPAGGSFYGMVGARPNWAPGESRTTAMRNVPAGYYFNPAAFTPAVVKPGQPIPSAHDPTALAGDFGTDIGDVGRNPLRGPRQTNWDVSIGKVFPVGEGAKVEFCVDFFNLLNHPSRDNPVSDISSPVFGRIVAYSSSPRIVQFALKFKF